MILSLVIPKTLAEVFALACRAYGKEPTDELFSSWRAALTGTPIRDVYDAFVAHQRNTALDIKDGRPVGRWFPTPADLLAQAEAKARIKIGGRSSLGYCGHKDCESGWVDASDSQGNRRVRRCPRCSALWASG
jgi:hypothetical protein